MYFFQESELCQFVLYKALLETREAKGSWKLELLSLENTNSKYYDLNRLSRTQQKSALLTEIMHSKLP